MSCADISGDLRAVTIRFDRVLRQHIQAMSLSLTELSTLATLRREGPMTAAQLAVMERVTPALLTRTVTALGDAGLLIRQPDTTDKRMKVLSLTPAGTTIIDNADRTYLRWLVARLAQLNTCQQRTLHDAIVSFGSLLPIAREQ